MKSFSVNKLLSYLAVCTCLSAASLGAQEPVFVADLANPNDFGLFANGGWDGNWYVGYNNCWVQKLQVPAGKYSKAFVGAKLGRMKNFQPDGKAPWQKKAYDGEIYMAVSSTVSWTRAQSFYLTPTSDIPLESDPENAVDGAGESRWFWREVPIKHIQPGQDHFLALWSPTKELDGIAKAPVLASGWGNKDIDSWLSSDVKGSPPSDPEKAMSTPVTIFEPALALKLIPDCSEKPETCPQPLGVKISRIETGQARGREMAPRVVWASIQGQAIDRAWVEISADGKEWSKAGRMQWSAPYAFTIRLEELTAAPDGKILVRVTARDIFENESSSEPKKLTEDF
ncbi:MAG: hypothetical protein A2901_05535 [Elusimicrobia bacterium RIFCSPLOWO2_01_FULL_54_10]|nr:MAG: hypothetical protein A2901_05535 [Elusimicrobia bacterium RIFCSPLOWO2_01_FULL_54_10]